MNWSKVKTAAIIILAAINVFFIINLQIQYVNTRLIPDKTLRDTAMLLDKSGITVDIDEIPNKKPSVRVYENTYGEDYAERIIKRLTGQGTENTAWHMINNGTKCIIASTGDEFEFSELGRFEITYRKNTDLDITPDSAYIEAFTAASNTVPDDDSQDRRMRSCIERFLFSNEYDSSPAISSKVRYSIVPKSVRYDNSNEWYVVTAHEQVDGYPLYSNGLTFVVKDDEVIFMTGELMLLDPSSSYTTALADQINILFEEKAYIESQRLYESLTGVADSTSHADESDNAQTSVHRIISLSVGYCVSWNSDRTIFYLIPAWEIVYSDGTSRIRNAINGSLYAV